VKTQGRRCGLAISVAAILFASIGSAGAARGAQPVAMAGRWFDRRGVDTYIPAAKGGIPAGPTAMRPDLPDYVNTLMTTGGSAMGFLTRSVAPPNAAALFNRPEGMLARGAGAGGPASKFVIQDGTSTGMLSKPPAKLTIAGNF
jgi:hypothetical protein